MDTWCKQWSNELPRRKFLLILIRSLFLQSLFCPLPLPSQELSHATLGKLKIKEECELIQTKLEMNSTLRAPVQWGCGLAQLERSLFCLVMTAHCYCLSARKAGPFCVRLRNQDPFGMPVPPVYWETPLHCPRLYFEHLWIAALQFFNWYHLGRWHCIIGCPLQLHLFWHLF